MNNNDRLFVTVALLVCFALGTIMSFAYQRYVPTVNGVPKFILKESSVPQPEPAQPTAVGGGDYVVVHVEDFPVETGMKVYTLVHRSTNTMFAFVSSNRAKTDITGTGLVQIFDKDGQPLQYGGQYGTLD